MRQIVSHGVKMPHPDPDGRPVSHEEVEHAQGCRRQLSGRLPIFAADYATSIAATFGADVHRDRIVREPVIPDAHVWVRSSRLIEFCKR